MKTIDEISTIDDSLKQIIELFPISISKIEINSNFKKQYYLYENDSVITIYFEKESE